MFRQICVILTGNHRSFYSFEVLNSAGPSQCTALTYIYIDSNMTLEYKINNQNNVAKNMKKTIRH